MRKRRYSILSSILVLISIAHSEMVTKETEDMQESFMLLFFWEGKNIYINIKTGTVPEVLKVDTKHKSVTFQKVKASNKPNTGPQYN